MMGMMMGSGFGSGFGSTGGPKMGMMMGMKMGMMSTSGLVSSSGFAAGTAVAGVALIAVGGALFVRRRRRLQGFAEVPAAAPELTPDEKTALLV